jgi:hypothetical protein
MAPPFVIEPAEIDWAVDQIEHVLNEALEDIAAPLGAK